MSLRKNKSEVSSPQSPLTKGTVGGKEIAKKARLSLSTVWRIEQRVTKLPRFKTIYLLAKAAGFELTVELNKRLRLKVI